MKRPSTRILKDRINSDLEKSSAAVQIGGLRQTPKGYEYTLPTDQFDELSKEEYRTIRRIVKKHCGTIV